MSEKSKAEQRERYRRSMRHDIGYEEQKQRKAGAAKRRAERSGQSGRGGARREWDEDHEGEAGFEKIRRPLRTARGDARGTVDIAGLPRAIVSAVHHGRVELQGGTSARIAGHLVVDPQFRLAVGDEVAVRDTDGSLSVQARLERCTCLSRPDPGNPNRALVIAANVDVAVIVVATRSPALRPGLIDRLLLALAHGGVAPAICVNKLDLLPPDEFERLEQILAPYVDLGCEVFRCSATSGAGVVELRSHLAGKTGVFVGHSGVGKSSILNALDPGGQRTTAETREHDGKGRHTTTWSSLRELSDGTRVIDTPGVRSFGLDRLDPVEIRAGFAEFEPFARGCSYSDCSHVHEPACEVRRAVADGALSAARHASYVRILDDT